MLTKAKNAKASRFDCSKGSPRLRAAIGDINLGGRAPGPIPLRKLKALGVPCGVDTAALDAAEASSSAP